MNEANTFCPIHSLTTESVCREDVTLIQTLLHVLPSSFFNTRFYGDFIYALVILHRRSEFHLFVVIVSLYGVKI